MESIILKVFIMLKEFLACIKQNNPINFSLTDSNNKNYVKNFNKYRNLNRDYVL